MSRNIFAPDEVLKLAVKIEVNGRKFYSAMAGKVEDDKLKSALNFLSQQEAEHIKIFEDILSGLNEGDITEVYAGEYEAYLKALAGECVFTQNLVEKKTEKGFSTPVEILDFALRIEKDSIVLYTEMKNNLLRNQASLDKVIDEERRHFVLISGMKQEYAQ